ncbi:hypothetical protein ASC83_01860 [Acidovorax sp. Root402]|nr:hypothetical protein ASC83_01860 [Acidovorax sp. Root402]
MVVVFARPADGLLQPILANGTNIDLQTASVASMRWKFFSFGQTDVTNADFSLFCDAPAMLKFENEIQHLHMGILPSSTERSSIGVIARFLRHLRQHEKSAFILRYW